MINKLVLFTIFCVCSFNSTAQDELSLRDKAQAYMDSAKIINDSAIFHGIMHDFDPEYRYKIGKVKLSEKVSIQVPKDQVYLDSEQFFSFHNSIFGLRDFKNSFGFVLPQEYVFSNKESCYFNISYENEGYIITENWEEFDVQNAMNNYDLVIRQGNDRFASAYGSNFEKFLTSIRFNFDKKVLHFATLYKRGFTGSVYNWDFYFFTKDGFVKVTMIGLYKDFETDRKKINEVINSVEINPSYSYDAFNSGEDKVANYSLKTMFYLEHEIEPGFFNYLIANAVIIFPILLLISFFLGYRHYNSKRKTNNK